MRKKLFYLIAGILTLASTSTFAQSGRGSTYKNAIGLRIDLGTGSTGFGPNFKHKFSRNNSIDAAVLFFEGDVVGLGAEFQYNAPIAGAPGLDWYAGIGPQLMFYSQQTSVGIRPVAGIDYKIPGAPLNFAFDWRPRFDLSPRTDVIAGKFGLSLRAAF